jgi:dTDP-4-amino-4,6-dideoxygalactose transaminase
MTEQPIPLVDLAWQHTQIADDIADDLDRIMRSGGFIDGPHVAAFEADFAAFSGARYAVGCASGTDALELALRAADIGPGDEVIIPANTFVATAEAVVHVGAVPRFVDVDPTYLLMDPAAAAAAVTARTRAIIPVHLYGQVAPMAPLRKLAADHGLAVIADAAQCQGATGDGQPIAHDVVAAATSFYPGKNLGAYGDAGAVVTDDADVAAAVRSIGHHGQGDDRYQHVRFGWTSRLDALQAVVLRAKLARLTEWNGLRRAAAGRYDELLQAAGIADRGDVVLPATVPGNEHVWHLYVLRVPERDAVLDALRSAGVGAGVHYPIALTRQPVFAEQAQDAGQPACPVAEAAAPRLLTLPLFPGITEAQQSRVVDALAAALPAPR